jgi:hypothetical protein
MRPFKGVLWRRASATQKEKKKFVRAVEPREGNVFADVQLPDWDKSIGS